MFLGSRQGSRYLHVRYQPKTTDHEDCQCRSLKTLTPPIGVLLTLMELAVKGQEASESPRPPTRPF